MRVITVIPIARGIKLSALTYFTSHNVASGALVSVPLRGKDTPALVIRSTPAKDLKATLKSESYRIKRINSPLTGYLFSSAYMRAVHRTAEYYAGSLGGTLSLLMPRPLISLIAKDELMLPKTISEDRPSLHSDKVVLDALTARRYEHYKNMVRESFAKGQSIFILAHTRRDGDRLMRALTKGIENRSFQFHGSLSSRALRERWNGAIESERPVLIIGTGAFLCIPREDVATIIVEREGASAYRARVRPRIDYRLFAEYLVEERGGRIVFADLPLRVETHARYQRGEYEELAKMPLRVAFDAAATILDMRTKRPEGAPVHIRSAFDTSTPEPFRVIGRELEAAVTEVLQEGKSALLFSGRRGLSATTICLDCGEAVMCEISHTPLVLHATSSGNQFVCHSCGLTRTAEVRCANCTSWRLQSFGIGSQRVEEHVRALWPHIPRVRIDSDSAATDREAASLMRSFESAGPAILIGTERMLGHLEKPVALSAIVSIDSLLSIPEWNAAERIMRLIARVRESTAGNFYLQTRNPDLPLISWAVHGSLAQFYRAELRDRKQFGYPPYARLIRIDAAASKDRIEELMALIEERFATFGFFRLPRMLKLPDGTLCAGGLVRIPASQWPHPEILAILASLPPSVSATVDPDRIV